MKTIPTTPVDFTAIYASTEHWVDFFRADYGPMNRAFAALDEPHRIEFHEALVQLARNWNRSERGTLAVPAEYLEAVITRS